MSECSRLSDRIPAVVQDQSQWTLEEMHHLRSCDSCRREWELVQLTAQLGDGILPVLPAEATSSALLRRLKRARKATRRTWGLVGIAAAASIVALVWVGEPSTRPRDHQESTVTALQIPLPELEGLPPAELDSLLRSMDEPADVTALENPDLDDLDSAELQAVLESWEG